MPKITVAYAGPNGTSEVAVFEVAQVRGVKVTNSDGLIVVSYHVVKQEQVLGAFPLARLTSINIEKPE